MKTVKEVIKLMLPNYCKECNQNYYMGSWISCWYGYGHLRTTLLNNKDNPCLAYKSVGEVCVSFAFRDRKGKGKLQHMQIFTEGGSPKLRNLQLKDFRKIMQEDIIQTETCGEYDKAAEELIAKEIVKNL